MVRNPEALRLKPRADGWNQAESRRWRPAGS